MGLGTIMADAWNGIRRNLSTALAVVLVTLVSVYLLGLGLLAQRQADQMKGYWYDRVQVSIYLCTDTSAQPNCDGGAVTDAQKSTIESQLDELRPLVENVYYESEQEAFDRFREQFKNSPISENVRVGDIPQSYRVQLSDPSRYDVVVSSFQGAPGVASVQDQEKVLNRFFKVINYITGFSVLLAALMALCAVLLMGTTIRQAAFTRRREISIMKLVGASNWTIRTPFLLEVIIAGVIGTLGAIGLLWATVHFIFNRYLNTILLDQAMIGAADVWVIAPWLLGGVVVLAVVTGATTLWRYLRV
ncbi:permease-like cell division protein FtsX [Kribbia dieselivorans]|uniref:permease-like cell division protein FtsX n=1 Tax=Kribbia dieselivorans TaxID=331526 RepID=UPI0008396A83|nr:permease-like cell division protein FtsX [Kribbia dieselivorans]